MPALKLTKRTIEALPLQPQRPVYFRDTEQPGFGVRVGARRKSFFVETTVASRNVRHALGNCDHLGLDRARQLARTKLGEMVICDEPTFEGLTRQLGEGPGFAGVCSSEGGQFLGGYAMNPDNKLKSAAHFSKLWDGAPIRRTRGGDGSIVLAGRRATMHLMVQPGVGDSFLRDPLLRDQGFHSRVLLAGPPSRMGVRFYEEPTVEQQRAYDVYVERLAELLQREPARPDPAGAELDPRTLKLSPGARARLIEYYNEVEAELSPTGALRDISGFANKLPEHAARLAGLFCFISDPDALEVDIDTIERGVAFARWYASEALRLYNAGYLSPELQEAEALRLWLVEQWRHDHVSIADLLQLGPNRLRDKTTLERAVEMLARAGWLVPADAAVQIGQNRRRKSWRIVRGRL